MTPAKWFSTSCARSLNVTVLLPEEKSAYNAGRLSRHDPPPLKWNTITAKNMQAIAGANGCQFHRVAGKAGDMAVPCPLKMRALSPADGRRGRQPRN
ncbi:MAG TPA: hypothetical protein VG347_12505 [Verrucomicrobiae bacterium]|nr:hypothetical protein [Verrucomicrobiae bacterium]